MLRDFIVHSLAITALCACSPQQADTKIDLSYGGPGKDGLRTIEVLADGGFILGGWRDQTKDGHVGDGYLINIGPDGETRWDRTVVTNGNNRVSNVFEQEDGRIVIVVEEFPVPEDPGQVVVMELSADGGTLKQHIIGEDGPDLIEVMRQTPDGGYIFVGESADSIDGDYQGWIGKMSASFDIEWEHRVGGNGSDVLNDVVMLADGSVIGVGMLTKHSTDKNNPARPWIVKVSPSGDVAWTQTLASESVFSLRGVAQSAANQIILAGYSRNWEAKEFDSWIGAISLDGQLIWEQNIGSPGYDQLIALETKEDGDFIALGSVKNEESDYDLMLVQFSASGDEIVPHVYNKPGRQFGRVASPLKDDWVAVGGFDMQTGDNGDQLWFLKTNLGTRNAP